MLQLFSGSGWSPAANRHGAFGAENASDGEITFSAVHEIMASAHKPKHFDGENCKTEPDFYGRSASTEFFPRVPK